MDGRWNHLRDVAGVSVILDTAVLPGSSSLFRWACFDRRQNRLRDVARRPVSLDTLPHTQIRASLGRDNHDPRSPSPFAHCAIAVSGTRYLDRLLMGES